jgi:Tol biopolymer transport system component
MSTFLRSPTALACALAAAGFTGAEPAHAEWIYGRLMPEAPTIQANGHSDSVDVSNDGKTVVFSSSATNWVAGELYPNDKAIAVDLDSGLIEIVSRTTAGVVVRGESPVASRDGRYVAFLNYAENLDVGVPTTNWQVARKDRLTGDLELVSANAVGEAATLNDDDTVSISGNGRYVAFESVSPNLGVVLPDSYRQVFVKDMDTGQVELASMQSGGGAIEEGCELYPDALSDDGRFLVFTCRNELLAGAGTGQVYVRDLVQDSTELVSRGNGAGGAPAATSSNRPSLSPSGRFVVFQNPLFGGLGGDSATHSGIYVRDRVLQTTVSVPAPAIAGFNSCYESDVSDAGTVLMECSSGSVTNVYLHVPGLAGTPVLVSNGPGDVPGNGQSGYSLAVDASGLSMVFESSATNLDPDDTNERTDVFVLVESALLDAIFGDGFED